MASHHQQCPANLRLKRTGSLRLCGRKDYGGCDSVVIRTHGQNYRIVCGRVKGYQYASVDGFHRFGADNNIDAPYVDGVSVTYGMHPRKHIWTYAAGLVQHPHHGGLKGVSCPRVGGTPVHRHLLVTTTFAHLEIQPKPGIIPSMIVNLYGLIHQIHFV